MCRIVGCLGGFDKFPSNQNTENTHDKHHQRPKCQSVVSIDHARSPIHVCGGPRSTHSNDGKNRNPEPEGVAAKLGCDPCRVVTSIARDPVVSSLALLNHRPMAGIPPGWATKGRCRAQFLDVLRRRRRLPRMEMDVFYRAVRTSFLSLSLKRTHRVILATAVARDQRTAVPFRRADRAAC
jgi:hypothetical protein